MPILVIGGNGFIGSHLVRELQGSGHEVAVLHRRARADLASSRVVQIAGDRNRLAESESQIRRFSPDVIVDLILSSGGQARQLMSVGRGIVGRVVAVSSMDVRLRVFRWRFHFVNQKLLTAKDAKDSQRSQRRANLLVFSTAFLHCGNLLSHLRLGVVCLTVKVRLENQERGRDACNLYFACAAGARLRSGISRWRFTCLPRRWE